MISLESRILGNVRCINHPTLDNSTQSRITQISRTHSIRGRNSSLRYVAQAFI